MPLASDTQMSQAFLAAIRMSQCECHSDSSLSPTLQLGIALCMTNDHCIRQSRTAPLYWAATAQPEQLCVTSHPVGAGSQAPVGV